MKVRTGIHAPALIDDNSLDRLVAAVNPPVRQLDERCGWCGAPPNGLCEDDDGFPMLPGHFQTNISRVEATRMFAPLPTTGEAN